MEECSNIKRILRVYSEASGQSVNFQKSTVCFSKQIGPADRRVLAGILGMTIVDHHKKYLGLPCITSKNKRLLFDDIKHKVWKKLQNWSNRFFFWWW